jgi:hypothetical protein
MVKLFRYYPARQAAFGAAAHDFGELNLMLPPRNQSTLCEYPRAAAIQNNKNGSAAGGNNLTQPSLGVNLAILVATGTCTAQHQAQNAVRLRNEAGVTLLRYLIVEGEPRDGNLLGMLVPETNDTSEIDSSLVVLGVTYRTGLSLREEIASYQEVMSSSPDLPPVSPYLFDNASANWDLVADIGPYISKSNSSTSDSFYWFRVLLFTILIVSPCIRAAYLWWVGGGRVRFRRNERGRIVGLQYIRCVLSLASPAVGNPFPSPCAFLTVSFFALPHSGLFRTGSATA